MRKTIRVALATLTFAPLAALAQSAPGAAVVTPPGAPSAAQPAPTSADLADRHAAKPAPAITGLDAALASATPRRVIIGRSGDGRAVVVVDGAPYVALPDVPARRLSPDAPPPATPIDSRSLLVFRDADRATFKTMHPLLTPDIQRTIRPLAAEGTAQPAAPPAAPANSASAGAAGAAPRRP